MFAFQPVFYHEFDYLKTRLRQYSRLEPHLQRSGIHHMQGIDGDQFVERKSPR